MLALRSLLALIPALAMLVPSIAGAQQVNDPRDEIFFYRRATDRLGFDLQLFEPSTSPRSITTLDLGTVPSHLSFTLGLWSSFAYRPWVVRDFIDGVPVANSTRPLVGFISQTELHASLGLFEYLEIGLALPVVLVNHVGLNSDRTGLDLSQGAPLTTDARVGDIRGYVKAPIIRGEWPVAARLAVTFPVNGNDAFAGNMAWTLTGGLAVSHAFGPLATALNVGYRFRQRNGLAGAEPFVLDDEVVWGLGGKYDVMPNRLAVNLELIGRIGIAEGALQANRNPVELLLGATVQATDSLALQIGISRGISAGYGTPEFRVFVGGRYNLIRGACTTGPEDYDGFQDGDYCGDPDNDADGIPDTADRCPNDLEDRDGFLDEDGCPEPDNDADAVADDNDRCPIEPEDQDGFDDTDGCPEGDNDRDGVADRVDDCPMEPEDLDNFQDQDGCPEPGPEAVVVTRTESHLLLSQRVFFDYDSDNIRSVSLPILQEVAVTLRRNPDITRVRIEGYTDTIGNQAYNLDLSYRRARAVVDYLVSQGVPRENLEYQGYGSQHPVADDATPEGQALNRRVEFTILRQAVRGHPAAQPAPATTPANGTAAPAPTRRRRH